MLRIAIDSAKEFRIDPPKCNDQGAVSFAPANIRFECSESTPSTSNKRRPLRRVARTPQPLTPQHNRNEAVAPSAFRTMRALSGLAAFRSRADGRLPRAPQERANPAVRLFRIQRRSRLPGLPIIPQFGFFERSRIQTMRIRLQPLEGFGQPPKAAHPELRWIAQY